MSVEEFHYQGADLLQIGDVLVNYNRSIAKMVVRYAPAARPVLDFGAGIGTLSEKVRSLGVDPLCFEPDATQRAELERRGLRSVASLDEIPDQSLGYIYSSNVLEHIEDDLATLRSLRKKLQPGGRLFLYVPAFASLYSSMDSAVGHWRRYERTMFEQKLQTAGFNVETMFYADVLGYFATGVYKLVGNTTSAINTGSLRTYDRYVFPVGEALERVFRFPFGKNIVAVAANP